MWHSYRKQLSKMSFALKRRDNDRIKKSKLLLIGVLGETGKYEEAVFKVYAKIFPKLKWSYDLRLKVYTESQAE